MQKTLIQGRIQKEIEEYNQNKKIGELLSKDLNEIKETFKATEGDFEQIILSVDETFEAYKKEYEKSLNIVVPMVEPIGQDIITSAMLMNMMEHGQYLQEAEFDASLVNQFQTSISDEQVVVAVGPSCTQLQIGDIVKIRFTDFFQVKNPNSVNRKEESTVPLVEINGTNYLSMHERNIKYIYQTDGYFERRTIHKTANKKI